MTNFLIGLLFILLGLIVKKSFVRTRELSKYLIRLVVNIILPVVVFYAISNVYLNLNELFFLPIVGIAIPLILLGLSFTILSNIDIEDKVKGVILCSSTIANVSFFLMPIFSMVFGPIGVAKLAVYDIGNSLIAYSLSFALAKMYGKSEKGTLITNLLLIIKSPIIWGLILGIFANSLSIKFPILLQDIFGLIQKINFFLVMFIFGTFIEFRFSRIKYLFVAIFVKMILGMCVGYLFSIFLGLSGVDKWIVICAGGSPVGMNVLVYAVSEKLDEKFASDLISLSLLVGVILLIPILIIAV